jgi:hypothetical protein
MWPYLWRALLPFAALIEMDWLLFASVIMILPLVAIRFLLHSGSIGSLLNGIALPLAVGLVPLQLLRVAWLWRFVRAVRRFRTATHGQIVLHYAPEHDGKWDVPVLFQRFEEELDRLTRRFSSPLQAPVVVFLFDSHVTISKVFGPHHGGTALTLANAIVIPDDCDIERGMRHEFAHLFSSRWSERAPPLLSEGLSVWLERDEDGRSIDAVARPLMHGQSPNLSLFLNPRYFFSEPHRQSCYALAGSFCGFLIRRYGWERFEKLYNLCNGYRFEAKFSQCYQMSLEEAEKQWRSVMWGPGLLLVEESRTGVALTRARDGCGMMRNIDVFIDDHMVAAVPYGGRLEFPLLPGNHSMWVKMDWCRSPAYEVTLRPGEMVELESCIPWRGFWALLSIPTGLLRPARAFVVRPAPDPKSVWAFRELWEGVRAFLGLGVFLVSMLLLLHLVLWAMNMT